MIKNCKKLTCVTIYGGNVPLNSAHNHNLQQLYIDSTHTDVPDHFMTSVSAHGGLVHVVMIVEHLTFKGVTSLVQNSPKLIKLHLCVTGSAAKTYTSCG